MSNRDWVMGICMGMESRVEISLLCLVRMGKQCRRNDESLHNTENEKS